MNTDNNEQTPEHTSDNHDVRVNSWQDYQDFISHVPSFIADFTQENLELSPEQQAFHNKHFNREEMTNQLGFINGKLVHIRITLDATEHRVDDFALLRILPRQHAKKLTKRDALEENTTYALDNILSDLRTTEGSKW